MTNHPSNLQDVVNSPIIKPTNERIHQRVNENCLDHVQPITIGALGLEFGKTRYEIEHKLPDPKPIQQGDKEGFLACNLDPQNIADAQLELSVELKG